MPCVTYLTRLINQLKGSSAFWVENCLKAPGNFRMVFIDIYNKKGTCGSFREWEIYKKTWFLLAAEIYPLWKFFWNANKCQKGKKKPHRYATFFLLFPNAFMSLLITLIIHFSHESDTDHTPKILHWHQMNATLVY